MPAGEPISASGDGKRGHVRRHMPAIGQQRHRTELQTGKDFDDHHCRRQHEHPTRSAFTVRRIALENVAMFP